MRHQDLTLNHRLESFVYATEALREAATGFVFADRGRIAFQSDNGTYWRLIDEAGGSLAWQLLSGRGNSTFAIKQTTQASPTGVTNAAGSRMMGLGKIVANEAKIIPNVTGKLRISINGNVSHTGPDAPTGVQGCFLSAVFGNHAVIPAPENQDFVVGTGFGYQVRFTGPRAIGLTVPFSISAAASGFLLNTTYWFDLQLSSSVPTGTASVSLVTMTIVELP